MNKKYYILFIVKNISCIQFSSCHTSDKKFLASNFSQTAVHSYNYRFAYVAYICICTLYFVKLQRWMKPQLKTLQPEHIIKSLTDAQKSLKESNKLSAKKWRDLSEEQKAVYEQKAQDEGFPLQSTRDLKQILLKFADMVQSCYVEVIEYSSYMHAQYGYNYVWQLNGI